MRARSKRRLRYAVVLASVISLLLGFTPGAQALDRRIIDIAQLTWNGAPAPTPNLGDLQTSIDGVRANWLSYTQFEGDTTDSGIEFSFGKALSEPIRLTSRFECEATNFNTVVNALRADIYKKLGISESKDRYLAILIPNAGCLWMGRALIGDAKSKGGSLVLHNTANAFVFTHELGHTLGLGHSNLVRCGNGASDGAWGSACKAIEYGGTIDVMGNVETTSTLSTYHQWRLGLLDQSEIAQSWKSEKVNLLATDVKGGVRAVFLRDGDSSYWIEYRRPKPGLSYKPGIVIYRSDPPPSNAIESPNIGDSLAANPGPGITTDIWMLNLDDYVYSSSGRASGSMSLPESKSTTLRSGNISISFSIRGDGKSIELSITRKPDTTPPPTPILSLATFWQFPDAPLLQVPYEDKESAIAYYDIKRDEEITKIEPAVDQTVAPTYLSPFEGPRTLRVRDLPEGNYQLAIRSVDLWGNASPWSETRKVSIDRGSPVLAPTLRIKEATSESASISLSDLKDAGSGLCETVLVNPEGFVLARSSAKSAPEFTISSEIAGASKIQTFDCLGNGREASFNAKYSFIPASDAKRSGKWKAATGTNGGWQCTGKCTAYFTTDGSAQIQVGSGSATLSVANKEVGKIASSTSKNARLSEPFLIGDKKRSVKIEGQNLLLFGLAKASVNLGKISEISRIAGASDISLEDKTQVALSKLGFRASDFEQGWFVLPMGGGTTLNDPTLDFCATNYQSDKNRTLRRQVAASKVGSPYLFLSTEVVKYNSERSAKDALNELITNAKSCVSNGGGNEQGGIFTKYQFKSLPKSNDPYFTTSSSFVAHTIIGSDTNARSLLAFYQFQGSYFTGLYIVLPGGKGVSDEEIQRWTTVASLMMNRMKQGVDV